MQQFIHWLPAQYRIVFKLCRLRNVIKIGQSPQYLADSMQPVSERSMCQKLGAARRDKYTTPRLRTKFSKRAFSYAGPAAWNFLPDDIRSAASFTSCRPDKKKTSQDSPVQDSFQSDLGFPLFTR
jgi:hypothetical protein